MYKVLVGGLFPVLPDVDPAVEALGPAVASAELSEEPP